MTTVSDAEAKAVEATALAVREATQALRDGGGYLARIFGSIPDDLVGYLFGDRLKVVRAEQIARLATRVRKINEERGVEADQVSRAISIPLLIAAADETREELVDLWAKLLASASDPKRGKHFRIAFIEMVKRLDPIDAMLLESWLALHQGSSLTDTRIISLSNQLHVSVVELNASLENLERVGFAVRGGTMNYYEMNATAKEFISAIKS